jgi:DNA repair protein RecO (recombination protein O)
MPPVKARGVVLRYANYREADRILTLFTAEQGKISAVARGCRKPSGRLRAACDYFVFGEWMLRPAGNGLGVTSCAVLDSFYDLRTDYDALCCAFYMRDLCDAVTGDGQPNLSLFTLFVRCLGALCHQKANAAAVRTAFEIRTMDLLGLGPSLDRCAVCGGEAIRPEAFSVPGGGALCGECASDGQNGGDFRTFRFGGDTQAASGSGFRHAARCIDGPRRGSGLGWFLERLSRLASGQAIQNNRFRGSARAVCHGG